jgi:hypothetical protein
MGEQSKIEQLVPHHDQDQGDHRLVPSYLDLWTVDSTGSKFFLLNLTLNFKDTTEFTLPASACPEEGTPQGPQGGIPSAWRRPVGRAAL